MRQSKCYFCIFKNIHTKIKTITYNFQGSIHLISHTSPNYKNFFFLISILMYISVCLHSCVQREKEVISTLRKMYHTEYLYVLYPPQKFSALKF